MNGIVIAGSRSGTRIRDDRYGTLWELVAPAVSACKHFGFAHVEVDPGQESPAHYHRKTEEMYYITRGGGTMTLGEVVTHVQPGDSVVIPVGEIHKIRADAEGLAFVCVTVPPYDPEDDFEVEAIAEVMKAVADMDLEQLCKDAEFPSRSDWQRLCDEIEVRQQEPELNALITELRNRSTTLSGKMWAFRVKSGMSLIVELDERRQEFGGVAAQRIFLIYLARWVVVQLDRIRREKKG